MINSFPRVELFQTEKRTLFSKLIGQEYQLSVRWPGFPEPTQKRFPVLYFLDGDAFFGLAASLTDHFTMFLQPFLWGLVMACIAGKSGWSGGKLILKYQR